MAPSSDRGERKSRRCNVHVLRSSDLLSAVNEGAILGKEGYVEYMISDKGAGDRTVISK